MQLSIIHSLLNFGRSKRRLKSHQAALALQTVSAVESRILLDGPEDDFQPYTPPNTAPVSNDGSYFSYASPGSSTTTGSVALLWSDGEGDPLTFSSDADDFTMNADGSWVFQNPVDYFDPVTISYECSDGTNSVIGYFQITYMPPNVSVTTEGSTAERKVQADVVPAYFVITRDGPTERALTVYFTLTGSALLGTDYSSDATISVTIPSGSPSKKVMIKALANQTVNDERTAILTLQQQQAYSIETQDAILEIGDNDRWAWQSAQLASDLDTTNITSSLLSGERLRTFSQGFSFNGEWAGGAFAADQTYHPFTDWTNASAWMGEYEVKFDFDRKTGNIFLVSASDNEGEQPTDLTISSGYTYSILGHTATVTLTVTATTMHTTNSGSTIVSVPYTCTSTSVSVLHTIFLEDD